MILKILIWMHLRAVICFPQPINDNFAQEAFLVSRKLSIFIINNANMCPIYIINGIIEGNRDSLF